MKFEDWLKTEIEEMEKKDLDAEIAKDNFERGYLFALQRVRDKL